MIFDGRPTNRITAEDIRALITDRVREDEFTEFKREPYGPNEAGKKEMIKDVSALANAAGGYIVIGVEEDDHRAAALQGVTDAEQVRRSMLDVCLARIDPRLPELDIGIIGVDEQDIVVCRVPESSRKPHAAVPDREHHAFYLRYEDGVKLMTVAEIREAIQGDAVQRELAELRRELTVGRQQQQVADELDQEVDESGLLRLQTPDGLAQHAERLFRDETNQRPYFRLSATPLPPAGRDIREHREELARLLTAPPEYREHGFGLRLGVADRGLQQTAVGLRRPGLEYKHLRLYWNGHLEFWNRADDEWISWAEGQGLPVEERPFAPLSVIESTACFVLLMRDICRVIHHEGEAAFRLGLYGVEGRRLLPYAANTYGHMFGDPAVIGRDDIGVVQEDIVRSGPVTANVADLPGTVVFRLVSEVYNQLGYSREHIPHFDEHGRFFQDVEAGGEAEGAAQ